MGLDFDMSKMTQKLEEIEKKAKNDIAKKALNESADIAKDSIKNNAPEDSGKLKSSIDKGKYKGGKNASIEVGVNGDEDVKRYAFYQENGTERIIGKKYFKRGIQESKDEVKSKMRDVILEELGFK